MARIRLKSKQMAGFSSYMGTVRFENGVSVDHVSEAEARRLGSITAVEYIDDEGNAQGNAGMGQVVADMRSEPAPDVSMPEIETKSTLPEQVGHEPIDVQTDKDVKTDPVEDAEKELQNEIDAMTADITDEGNGAASDAKVYSREELEEVADKNGISGLRAIGEVYEARSNSIEGLIDKILSAQPEKS